MKDVLGHSLEETAEFDRPDTQYRDFFETWLRVALNIAQAGRPVVLFAMESGIDLDYQLVDLFTGEQYKPEYSAINPSHQVPVRGLYPGKSSSCIP